MLGGLADGTGFSAAELESFTASRVRWWWSHVQAYRKAVEQ